MVVIGWMIGQGVGPFQVVEWTPAGAPRITNGPPYPDLPPYGDNHVVTISGTPEFHRRVAEALMMLEHRDAAGWQMVRRYVGRIEQSPKSGMNVDKRPPTFELADRSAQFSVTWCAGAIVHDAMHSKLFFDIAQVDGIEAVPEEAWTGQQAERICLAIQAETLARIGAPEEERRHLAGQDGTHFDVNRDGVNDAKDYEGRDW